MIKNAKNNAIRKVLNFNTGWLFYRGDITAEAATVDYNDNCWEGVTLPHTVRLEPKEWDSIPSYQGISWYRRHFTIKKPYNGEKIFLTFDGAMINSDVWLGGNHLMTNHGGYLPFTIDITNEVCIGGDNVIAVRVDSRDDWETPPGKPQKDLDFTYFGGLYRDSHIVMTDNLHITDAVFANKIADGGVFITYPEVSDEKAVIRIQTNVKNEYNVVKNASVEAAIVDEEGHNVVAVGESDIQLIKAGTDFTFVQTLTVTMPKLWSMDHPNLYTIFINLKDEGHCVDDYQTRIGIRRIEFTADQGFFINNKRTLLNGVNHHEDYVYIGNAVSDSMLYRDVKKIKDAGFNFIRTGHYPHKQSFMNDCDELGIAVIIPTPGWQYYTQKGEFASRSLQMTRKMVRLYRNHPSVIVWEPVLNETWYPDQFAQDAYDAVHEEYPTDQAYAASDIGAPKGNLFDVVYKEAYSETKPLITREWGDASHNVNNGERSGRKYGEKSLINSSLHRQNSLKGNSWKGDDEEDGYWDWAGLNANQRISGYALWSYNDYTRGVSKEIAYSGIVDRDRYPKFNYYWFQSQHSPEILPNNANSGPMVFIANYWLESSSRDIHVYTNTEEIKLYINEKLIETRKPQMIEYISHPIITFPNVPWEPGELKAEGMIDGEVATTYTVTTPGKPDHLEIEFDTNGIRYLLADGSDMIMAYVSVRDKYGHLVPTASDSISLHLSGCGILIGNGESRVKANPVLAEAGIAPAIIRSTLVPGDIILCATASGLKSGSALIKSVPYSGYFVTGGNNEGHCLINEKDVALNKPVIVSSEQHPNIASNMNDGNRNSYWLPDETDSVSWAQMDLGECLNIIGSKLIWTTNNNQKKYKIKVSVDGEDWITLVNQSDDSNGQNQFNQFASNARYVCIIFHNSGEMNEGINEFKLYGSINASERPIFLKQRNNIALGKKTNASSFSQGNEPSLAVNQNSNTMWQANSHHLPQWLLVDLEGYYSVFGVKILWGKDSTHYVYKIQLSKDGHRWLDVADKTTTGSYYHAVDFNIYSAMYVRIFVSNLMAGGGTEKVAIRELEIYDSESTEIPKGNLLFSDKGQ